MATVTSLLDGLEYADNEIGVWEADKDGTSNAGDTERLLISIVGAETATVQWAGWTSKTGGNQIIIECEGDAFHGGDLNATSSTAYICEALEAKFGSTITQDIVFIGVYASSLDNCFWGSATFDLGSMKFVNCIANKQADDGDGFSQTGSCDFLALNCVAFNGGTANGSEGFAAVNAGTSAVYNCIAHSFGRAIHTIDNVYNSWALDANLHDMRTVDCSYSIWDIAGSGVTDTTGNNPDGIVTDVDTAAANTILVADLTGGSEDFTPVEFSDTSTYNNIAIENGNDYSGTHSELANDITGQARGASPTIGAYEVVAGADYSGTFSATGVGSMAAVGSKGYKGTFSATGIGSLTALGSRSVPGTFSATGIGSIATIGSKGHPGTFSATGSGSASFVGNKGYPGTFSSTGVGSVSTIGTKGYKGTFSSIGVGSIATLGTRGYKGTFSATGVGSMSAIGTVSGAVAGVFSATGVGSLLATGTVGYKGAFSATGVGSMTALGKAGRRGTFQSIGVGSVAALGHRGVPASFSATGIGSVSAIGHRSVPGTFSAIGVGSMVSLGTKGHIGTFAAIGVGSMTSVGTKGYPGVFLSIGVGVVITAGLHSGIALAASIARLFGSYQKKPSLLASRKVKAPLSASRDRQKNQGGSV